MDNKKSCPHPMISMTPAELEEKKLKVGDLTVGFVQLKGTDAPRSEIQEFAEAMELMMRFHDPKKGDSWRHCLIGFLESKLLEEVNEYMESKETSELLDVANICMMLYMRRKTRYVISKDKMKR